MKNTLFVLLILFSAFCEAQPQIAGTPPVQINSGTNVTVTGGSGLPFVINAGTSTAQNTSIAAGTGISISQTGNSYTVTSTVTTTTVTGTGTATVTTVSANSFNVSTPTYSVSSGTGISASQSGYNITLTNSSPDQTVSLTGATTTTISGTYPNFTINSQRADVNPIYTVTLSLSSATILTLTVTPGVLAIPSVSGYAIAVTAMYMRCNFVTTAYTGSGTLIAYAQSEGLATTSAQMSFASSAFLFTANRSLKATGVGATAPSTTSSHIVVNQNIYVGNITSSEYTGDGTVVLLLQYQLLPYPF